MKENTIEERIKKAVSINLDTIKLINSMIKVAEIISKRDLSAHVVKEAVKNFCTDKNVKNLFSQNNENIEPEFYTAPVFVAYAVPVIESESGWGRKIDDYMICMTEQGAKDFIKEFNSRNTSSSAPNWYMQAENGYERIPVSDQQLEYLEANGNTWLSKLNKL